MVSVLSLVHVGLGCGFFFFFFLKEEGAKGDEGGSGGRGVVKKRQGPPGAWEPPPHKKFGKNNRHKQYYSALTDILRTYISRRWEVGAMEMTTDEIIDALRPLELPDKARMDLTAILRDGDLVKFAKATPEAETNENAYLKAYYFVEETKPATEQAEESDVEPANTQN